VSAVMSVRGAVWAICLGGVCACAARRGSDFPQQPEPAYAADRNPDAERWAIVRFQGAALARQRPNGEPWHRSQPDTTAVVVGGLLGLAAGNPTVGLAIGKALSSEGGDPLAPAPYVVLKVSGRSYRISPSDRTYAPRWDQPIRIDTRGLNQTEQVIVQVVDGVDDSLIGQKQIVVGTLLHFGRQTLVDVGAAATLDLDVDFDGGRVPQQYDVVIPSNRSLESLAGRGAPRWEPIPVWNGDTITITAEGSVCPFTFSSDCVGPAGAGDKMRSYNYDGFKDVPHASLVAVAPGARWFIGTSSQVRAEESGQVLLFVNDTDENNNEGSFSAHVVVTPGD
jgi:hypothetical protein